MQLASFFNCWRKEKLGLTLILSTLAVILVTSWVIFSHEQKTQRAHIYEQGLSIVRIISQVPFEQFADEGRLLLVLQQGLDRSTFAYAAVADAQGELIQQTTAPGVVVPQLNVASDPTKWIGERSVTLASELQVFEYHAPLFDEGDLAGHVRIGYFAPRMSLADMPIFATPALLIFLLVPLFYFLLKRETKPLAGIHDRLNTLAQQAEMPKLEISANAELSAFMNQFGDFLEKAQGRLSQLESDRQGLEVNTKLLTYQRARVEGVLECFPDGVLVLDETGAVSVVNQQVLRALAVERDQVLGQRPAQWCEHEDLVAFLALQDARSSRSYRSESLTLVPGHLQDTYLEVRVYPLFSPRDDAKILGTLVIFHNVTNEHAAKRSSSEFVSHMAHELKSPLNTLALYSEVLLSEDGDDPSHRIEAANVIHDEIERLDMLIQNILSITQIESGTLVVERHHAKLRDMLEDAFDTVKRNARDKHREFVLDLPRDLAPISLDKGLLRIAINNLLTNAIKYTDEQGHITLSAEEDDTHVRIHVKDDGIGIADEEQESIFSKFFRSEADDVRSRTGHGLGLSLARQIVLLHHGSLHVASNLGEGSMFTIELNKEQGFMREAI